MQRLPFLTGSRAYGNPTEESDFDMVVLVRDEDELDQFQLETGNSYGKTIRMGLLNVIAVDSEPEYDAWYVATQRMIEWRNQGFLIPKEQAILEIDKEHELRRIGYKRTSSPHPDRPLSAGDIYDDLPAYGKEDTPY